MSRRLLHHTKLDDFKAWLTKQGIEHREGQGDCQVLQVSYQGHWLALYERHEITATFQVKIKPHLTNDKRLDRLVSEFCRDRQASDAMMKERIK
jgi:hypothetical protein